MNPNTQVFDRQITSFIVLTNESKMIMGLGKLLDNGTIITAQSIANSFALILGDA